ncbi:GPGG-motif small membrane protein [Nocardioides insulae]|nr:GPGG-motif small membrane protein [Nocardioides insulae]
MTIILLIIAAIFVIAGIVSLIRGQFLWGGVLIVVGLLIGPGGISVFG